MDCNQIIMSASGLDAIESLLSLQAALLWSLAVQECALFKDWPQSALDWPSWPTAFAKQELILLEDQQVLFRGPR